MINANELRIGNWVIGYEGMPFQWGLFHYALIANDVEVDEIIRNPLPLTPEILGKCGFSERSLAFTGNIGFTIKEENFYIGLLSDEKGGWKFHNPHFNLTIKYLHQLQNLYFALTGEELIYKP